MNAGVAQTDLPEAARQPPGHGWSRARLFRFIALVYLAHVVLIFAFGARKQASPRAVKDVPQLRLADEQNQLIALTDPTLFALPHADDFVSALPIAALIRQRSEWPEATNYLPFTAALGGTFSHYAQPIRPAMAPLDFKPQPRFDMPELQIEPVFAQTSTLRLGGELAQRQWLAAPELPSWPDGEVLEPTVVQVLVDPDGDVVSAVVLESSGLDAADQGAIRIARGIHFTSAPRSTVGQMVFTWWTVPPATNSPAASL